MDFPNLNATKFAAAITDSEVIVVDVRRPDEYFSGHLADSIHIDVENPLFADEIKKLDTSKTYAIYCRSGRRSLTAIELMEQMGFTSFIHLENGILDWVATGYSVVA